MVRLKQVEGVSNAWVETFGERMLRRIEAFCQKSGHIPLDASDAVGKVVEPRERTMKVCVCVCAHLRVCIRACMHAPISLAVMMSTEWHRYLW